MQGLGTLASMLAYQVRQSANPQNRRGGRGGIWVLGSYLVRNFRRDGTAGKTSAMAVQFLIASKLLSVFSPDTSCAGFDAASLQLDLPTWEFRAAWNV